MLRQRAYLDLSFIPAGSDLAAQLFPGLGRGEGPPDELVVVSDSGGVYRGGDAWVMCLYALEDYREWSLRLAGPTLRPLARQGFALLSKQRPRIARWLNLASESEIAETLRHVAAPACDLTAAASPVPSTNGTT
jgi:hypothetical protein